jgi:uncharacterized protein
VGQQVPQLPEFSGTEGDKMNSVVHFEIPVDDLERAKKFYQGLFGWQLNDIPEMKYCMAVTTECDENNMPKEKGAINGGMYKRADGGSRTPVVVINVENVEEHSKKVTEAGGKVVMDVRQVGDMGMYAQVEDSEGNVIGLWQNLKKH